MPALVGEEEGDFPGGVLVEEGDAWIFLDRRSRLTDYLIEVRCLLVRLRRADNCRNRTCIFTARVDLGFQLEQPLDELFLGERLQRLCHGERDSRSFVGIP